VEVEGVGGGGRGEKGRVRGVREGLGKKEEVVYGRRKGIRFGERD